MANSDKKEFWLEILRITFWATFFLVTGFIIPTVLGFAFNGYESIAGQKPLDIGDIFIKNLAYFTFLFAMILGYLFFAIRELIVYGTEDAITSNKNYLFSTVIDHNPREDGFLVRAINYVHPPTAKWISNPVRMFLFFGIIFALVGLHSATTGSFFSGIPPTQFQVAPASLVIFAAEPAATTENGVFVFILLSIVLGFVLYFSKKLIPKNKNLRVFVYFSIAVFLVAPLFGLGWEGYHKLVYGNDDAKLLATFVFGFSGVILTVAFGSFIPWYVWHVMNNSFLKMSELATSNGSIAVITYIFVIITIIIWVSVELIIMKYKKKKQAKLDIYATRI